MPRPRRTRSAANARGIGFDLADPHAIAAALADVGDVDYLVLAAIERDANTVHEYDIAGALRLVTLKLVGYTEVIHSLAPRLGAASASSSSVASRATGPIRARRP